MKLFILNMVYLSPLSNHKFLYCSFQKLITEVQMLGRLCKFLKENKTHSKDNRMKEIFNLYLNLPGLTQISHNGNLLKMSY